MLLAKDCCPHPTGAETLIDRREIPLTPYAVLNGLSLEKKYMERVRCTICGREWTRHEDAQGEDI